MYVHTWWSHLDLRSCLGMSICAHAQESGITQTYISQGQSWGGRFLVMEGGEDNAAGPSQCKYLADSSVETSAEHS